MDSDKRYRELEEMMASLAARVRQLEKLAGVDTGSPSQKTPSPIPPSAGSEGHRVTKHTAASNGPDELESTIGGQWLNRVGIIAVLVGVSYFLKYAFDNAWIGPAGRVLTGLLGGLAILYTSEYIRRRAQELFSYSLTAIGLGVLYLSLWASAQHYALVPLSIAFAGMAVVTICAVTLAMLSDSEVIAGFAAIGAFLTPLLLSSGENRAPSLFAYILMLDIGVLVLLLYRSWHRLSIGALLGTIVLVAAWHDRHYTSDQFPLAFAAATLFFGIFFVIPIQTGGARNSRSLAVLAISNAAFSFLWMFELVSSVGYERASALLALGLALLYFLVAASMTATLASPYYFTLAASLVTIAIPIGLQAQWITIAWFAEAGGLLWAARKLESEYPARLGAVMLVVAAARLVLYDRFEVSRLFLNERMLAYAVAVAVLVVAAKSVAGSKKREAQTFLPVLIVTISALVLLALNLEIGDFWRRQAEDTGSSARGLRIARDFAYSALWMTYGAALMMVGFWKKSRLFRWQALILIAFTIAKVFLYDTLSLDRGYRILSFIGLGTLLLAISLFYQRDWLKLRERHR